MKTIDKIEQMFYDNNSEHLFPKSIAQGAKRGEKPRNGMVPGDKENAYESG
jgi:hypothetical protein